MTSILTLGSVVSWLAAAGIILHINRMFTMGKLKSIILS
jgi:hypothetical protein